MQVQRQMQDFGQVGVQVIVQVLREPLLITVKGGGGATKQSWGQVIANLYLRKGRGDHAEGRGSTKRFGVVVKQDLEVLAILKEGCKKVSTLYNGGAKGFTPCRN